MGFASWMLAVLLGLGTTLAYEPQGRSGARLSARWVGRTVMITSVPMKGSTPSDIQDIHIAIAGLDPDREVVFVEVRSTNGNFWRFDREARRLARRIQTRRREPRTGDAYIEPAWVETGSAVSCACSLRRRIDGRNRLSGQDRRSEVASDQRGARARAGSARTGRTAPAAGRQSGADGFQDVRIHISRLATKLTLNANSHHRTWRS